MSIHKQEYELSVWHETLGENGQKIEIKENIIGANDMTALGKATNVKFSKKLNGTHELTFEMPDKYFDSKLGKFVRNEFVDNLFNERKIKLKFQGEWYEFYIKEVSESKNFKSYIKEYTCSDAFIDELARNGYDIIFDTELYNNVEEIGTFSEIILEDSIWEYEPRYNWGDFTEFLEEKLFRIPIEIFGGTVKGHKLNYLTNSTEEIKNVFTKKKRLVEMGDDLARELNYYWDGYSNNKDENGNYKKELPLISNEVSDIVTDGFIYVPYSCLDFCYKTTTDENDITLTATEEVQSYIVDGKELSYALAPKTVDPNSLIQFIALPPNCEIEIDESGLIVNKDYTYVMTVEEWNNAIKEQSQFFYQFLPLGTKPYKKFIEKVDGKIDLTESEQKITGNWTVYYNGYLNKLGDIEVLNGKKISITDRTAINITPEIDQYVVVYNNHCDEYDNYYSNPNELWIDDSDEDFNKSYRVCSKTDTRQIIPQLARNLVQNGVNIKNTDGWEIAKLTEEISESSASLIFKKSNVEVESIETISPSGITFVPAQLKRDYSNEEIEEFNTIVNFGLVAQEAKIEVDKYYCFGLKAKFLNNADEIKIIIGEGGLISDGDYTISDDRIEFTITGADEINDFCLIRFKNTIENPYIAISSKVELEINEMWFFEAYTKGIDQFDDEAFYKYSGRELFSVSWVNFTDNENFFISDFISNEQMRHYIIFEDNVMPGDTYEYRKYFIQQVQAKTISNGETVVQIADTFNSKELLSENGLEYKFRNTNLSKHQLPYSAKDFTENDLTISTKYIDLNKCKYFTQGAAAHDCDCCFGCENGKADKICVYQKYGYCPYLFQTEKHCRKIRTLNGEKSNRFNLTQELSKVFEVYPIYYTHHTEQGKIAKVETEYNGEKIEKMDKKLFYITEKGQENKLGFRYELNLADISRTIKSDEIVTKLYVEDVDSELSKTGLCSIKTAEDNPSKDSAIYNFSYYTTKGILDKTMVDNDLYGVNQNDLGYLKQLGYYNSQYDKISNQIINLSSESFTELEANIQVNLEGIETAQKQLNKIKKQMEKYKVDTDDESKLTTYNNYKTKYDEQLAILNGLIRETLCDEDNNYIDFESYETVGGGTEDYSDYFNEITIDDFQKSDLVKQHLYSLGMLGQYNVEFNQLEFWRKQQASYLKEINQLSLKFFKKYEPYIKEGTWSDSNYLTDNAYYFGACEVSAEGAIPKVEYNISVVDLYTLPEYEDYKFDVADTTYVEDIGMFGINKITGLPNRLKVIISQIDYDLDECTNNSIQVQNFTTQFEDLFEQVTASVQSLSFNENIYKRASNFTSNQNITENSLQGTLDNNNITLLKTKESNIEIDKQGQQGSDINNHSNKYKLNGQGMFFSNNGGQSWDIGVGPGGINADYIKVGTLDAGKIRIVDSDYLYFLWDKDGIVAFRDPTSVNAGDTSFSDFAVFNRYGLSLVEDGKIKLRAGYSFSGTNGDYGTEDSTGKDVGFYLYDNRGNAIFSTRANNNQGNGQDDNKRNDSAKIELNGELLATNYLNSVETIYYTYNSLQYVITKQWLPVMKELNDNWNSYTKENGENSESTNLTEYCKSILSNGNTEESSTQFKNGDNTVTLSFYKREDYACLYQDKYYKTKALTVSGSGFAATTVVTINGGNLLTSNSKSLCNIKIKNEDFSSRTTSIDKEKNNSTISYYEDSNESELKEIEANKYYEFDDSIIYLYEDKESNISTSNSGEDSIAVFVHNAATNDPLNARYDGSGYLYHKRVFSCLKRNGADTYNLFSILSNGELYIGGRMIPLHNFNSDTPLNQLSDFLRFDYDYSIENTVRIDSQGRLFIGSTDILSYFREEIDKIGAAIADIGLIGHRHSFSVTANSNKKIVYVENGGGGIETEDLKSCSLSELLNEIDFSVEGPTDIQG